MPITGSSITNTATTGLPGTTTGIPTSFAVTAQTFVNPANSPTNAWIEFAMDGSLMVNPATTTYGHNYIGFALPGQLADLAQWLHPRYVSSAGIWAVGFGERFSNNRQVGIFVDGGERAVVAKPQLVESVSAVDSKLTITAHPFFVGDPVKVSSTGTLPNGIGAATTYYVVPVDANNIRLALTPQQAEIADTVIITSTGTGAISVNPVDVFRIERNGTTGTVDLLRNGTIVYRFGATVTGTLRGFYTSREAMDASSPVFSAIKVFGGI